MTRERFLERQKPVTIIETKDMFTIRVCTDMKIVMEKEKEYYEYNCNSFTEKSDYIDTTLLMENPRAFLDYQPESDRIYNEVMNPVEQAIIRGLTT